MKPATVKTIITANVIAAGILVVASTSILPNRPDEDRRTAETLSTWRTHIRQIRDAGGGSRYDDTTTTIMSQAAGRLRRRTRMVYVIWSLYWGSIGVLMLSTMAGASYLSSLQKLWPKDDDEVEPVEASVDKADKSDRKPPAEKAGE